jgi:hypothetical protein
MADNIHVETWTDTNAKQHKNDVFCAVRTEMRGRPHMTGQ